MEDEDDTLSPQEAFDDINRTIDIALGERVVICDDEELLADLDQINRLLVKVLGLGSAN
jgi:hypothetical protein